MAMKKTDVIRPASVSETSNSLLTPPPPPPPPPPRRRRFRRLDCRTAAQVDPGKDPAADDERGGSEGD